MSESDLFFALLLGAMILIVTGAVLVWHYIASFRLYRKWRGGHWIYRGRWQRVTGDSYLYNTNINPYLKAEDHERH